MSTLPDLPEADQALLRDLVKTARQRIHFVPWTDRDGTHRHTALTQPENARITALAQRFGISKAEVLRRAAHIPVEKSPRPATPA